MKENVTEKEKEKKEKKEKKKQSKKKKIDNIDNMNETNKNAQNKENEIFHTIRDLKMDKEKIEMIIKRLKKIENKNCKADYEILCDILKNDLNINLNQEYPKEIKEALEFEIKDKNFHQSEFTCALKQIKYQIDSTGMIREKLTLGKGKIEFKDGITHITHYVKYRGFFSFNNTFKCPILFKNFDDEEVPSNKVIMCEIKSGFNLTEIKNQLTERINAIKYFKFNKDESPLYYIGIVNLDSKNIDKLNEYSNFDFEINENVLIVAAIDYVYFGLDLSYEINDGYLLFKEIQNLNNKIDNLEKKNDNIEKKVDNINSNFECLMKELKRMNPNYNFNFITNPVKEKNSICEEKKDNA